MFAVNTLLLALSLYAAGCDAAPTQEAHSSKGYDYIVVGGGTAGLALSTRLSQGLRDSSILVIEAGPAALDELGINVPGKKGSTLGTKYDWNFTTTPQESVKNRVFAQNRGKVLGGSSAINLLTYDRASEHEYDAFEQVGNPGWNWTTFLEMMKRSENFTSKNTEWYGDAGVNTNGPIHGTINRIIPTHQDGWIPTMNRLGIETNKEYLGGNLLGVSYSPNSIDPTHYNRSYSANSYLPLAGPQLTVMTEKIVAKVNMKEDGCGYRASGVTLTDGTFIAARREVILSAGSFQSPGLLEHSGIGNRAILAKAGVEQLIDLPGVGENLQDHIRIQSTYQVKKNYTSIDILRYNPEYAAEQLQLWVDGKLSLYDYAGSGYSFMTWKQAIGNDSELLALAQAVVGTSTNPALKKKLEWMSDPTIPQLEVIMSDGYTGVKGYPAPGTPLYGEGFFSLIAAIMHPLSHGSVHINSSDPLAKPIIDPNYLSNEHDLQAAIAAIKKCRQIALTPPLRDVWVSEYEPGLNNVNTDQEWKDFVLNTTLTIYHPVGTCAMLPRGDGGVVDPKLRVYGTNNLRVVDASIMPVLMSAHMQTAVYGVAEMAAEIIINDARGH
ncbi:GMC oxidoreductase [Venustampulla echinocandica]|uniref:GMC oxidoreductase n=1 Tax=Venustampulla echinocandica TaxID=2656787 RepID=A0A370U0B7_9HELO|nr:GMC oxidoreductase [Venustampulla echinocandica]RDL41218.1 GMC oxidoreductase [Venustampulla echinocandica]